jgi:hypothetical protein
MVYEEDGKVLLRPMYLGRRSTRFTSVIFEDGTLQSTTLTKIRERITNKKRVMKVTFFYIFVYEHIR